MNYFQNTNKIQEKELVPGIFAKMVHTDTLTVMHVRIEKGAVLPEHHHVQEQVTNIMEGELEMIIDGKKQLCKPGDVVIIPSNVPHAAVSPTGCKVIDVFNPVREDYKKL